MKRLLVFCVGFVLVALSDGAASAKRLEPLEPSVTAEEEAAAPLPIDLVEEEHVRLIVLDVLVVDSHNRTVPGLTLDDFEIVAAGRSTRADTLDVRCDHELGDARAVNQAENRENPTPSGDGGKIVLAFDYLHMSQVQRAEVLDHARELVRHGGMNGGEVMLAALNGGLRIEQTFSRNAEEVHESLHRMQRDITLWQPDFFHLSEMGWVSAMTALFDVLGTVPGPKKVVFFSAMADTPLDLEFREIAAQAAVSRCSVYPVNAAGLTTPANDAGVRGGVQVAPG
jgi:VWFA-related protein